MSKAKRPRARLPRGFVDNADQELLQRQSMITTILGVYQRYGFRPLETPIVEHLDALGKFLPDKDAPDEGVFALRDDDDGWLALRYDLTAPLARFVAQNRNELPLPYRRYQYGPVFRREKPGPGRFRQFYQCDFDTVGSRSMAADAEVCEVMAACLEAIGIPQGDYEIRLNNRKVLNAILAGAGLGDDDTTTPDQASTLRAHVLRSVDKLDRVGHDGVRLLLGEGRMDASGDFTKGVGLGTNQIDAVMAFVDSGGGSRTEVIDKLESIAAHSDEGKSGIEDLRTIDQILSATGIESDRAIVDPTVVRGLDYYTGPVCEAVLTFETNEDGQTRSFGSVGGGGRYDDLIKRFTGQETPACGGSVGVSRLAAALTALGRTTNAATDTPVVVTVMDSHRLADYQRMVTELRSAGITAELYLGSKGLGHQLKYADRRGSALAVIAGGDEFDTNTVTVKNLLAGKEISQTIDDRAEWLSVADVQHNVARDELVRAIGDLLDGRNP